MTEYTKGNLTFIVGNCNNLAEELWWYCECNKHSIYYRRLIFENVNKQKVKK